MNATAKEQDWRAGEGGRGGRQRKKDTGERSRTHHSCDLYSKYIRLCLLIWLDDFYSVNSNRNISEISLKVPEYFKVRNKRNNIFQCPG